jgi:elongation factor Ts
MAFTIDDLKKLRDITGAGMVDCKKALEESGGDMQAAIELLRKKGIAKSAKRGEREAREGMVVFSLSDDLNSGYIVEINAETDFVVRSDRFQQFAKDLASLAKSRDAGTMEELLGLEMNGSKVEEALSNLSGVIGEKLVISRFERILSGGTVNGYIHMAGRIGVLVAIDQPGQADLARDLAMQIAATDPKYISPQDVLAEEIDKEKETYREQLSQENKPENIMSKILDGKIAKYLDEICLTRQEYIKDDSRRVADILGTAKVEKFIRFSL